MDLLSYSLVDLIPFSRETYFRLFERYNIGVWPAPIIGLAMGLTALFTARRADGWVLRAPFLLTAACWVWVGWVFQIHWYAPLSWPGIYFGIGFLLQGLMMAVVLGRRPLAGSPEGVARDPGPGLWILVFALALQPLLGLLSGRPWYGLEVFGSAPDPTVVATLGFLLLVRHPLRWFLSIIPLAWCLISGATLWVLGVPTWSVMPLAAALYLGVVAWPRVSGRRQLKDS
ncbi:DUF6064 family protein [Thiocapsa rosea]|uniref:MFS transporter permease n=1 Tax=Thiocapsa rosea TaxID=69360 RepID=A0A495VEZ6_9GAMM|nr:DUF6064 family protein [Thiocapsa rosea]RKT46398.1 hypothetical protein BDD21_3911 [Thiocapsa rosea]